MKREICECPRAGLFRGRDARIQPLAFLANGRILLDAGMIGAVLARRGIVNEQSLREADRAMAELRKWVG